MEAVITLLPGDGIGPDVTVAAKKVLDAVAENALPLMDDMNGHPGMARFQADGYEIITF